MERLPLVDPAAAERARQRLGIGNNLSAHMQELKRKAATGEAERELAAIEAQEQARAAEQTRLIAEAEAKAAAEREHRIAELMAQAEAGIAAAQARADAQRDAIERARHEAMTSQRVVSPGEIDQRSAVINVARANAEPQNPSPDRDATRTVPLR
jgi:membrane protein involved in colicin uptake